MTEPPVTAIIQARDETTQIGPTTAAAKPLGDRAPVIDDASIDGTDEEAAAADARVIRLPRRSGPHRSHQVWGRGSGRRPAEDPKRNGEDPAGATPFLIKPIRYERADMTPGRETLQCPTLRGIPE
jgi:hypothetical protein